MRSFYTGNDSHLITPNSYISSQFFYRVMSILSNKDNKVFVISIIIFIISPQGLMYPMFFYSWEESVSCNKHSCMICICSSRYNGSTRFHNIIPYKISQKTNNLIFHLRKNRRYFMGNHILIKNIRDNSCCKSYSI